MPSLWASTKPSAPGSRAQLQSRDQMRYSYVCDFPCLLLLGGLGAQLAHTSALPETSLLMMIEDLYPQSHTTWQRRAWNFFAGASGAVTTRRPNRSPTRTLCFMGAPTHVDATKTTGSCQYPGGSTSCPLAAISSAVSTRSHTCICIACASPSSCHHEDAPL